MLAEIRQLGGFRDGEAIFASGATAYVGGSPLKLNAGGEVQLLTNDTGATAWAGVAANCQATDQLQGLDYSRSGTGTGTTEVAFYRATRIQGPSLLRFTSGTKRGQTDGAPYDTGLTFAAGDPLYVDSGGTWANTGLTRIMIWSTQTGATSGDIISHKRGHVIAVGSDYIDVELY